MKSKSNRFGVQIKKIVICGVVMFFGLLFFKFLPMKFYGEDILFDASMHVVVGSFILYIGYFFINHLKKLRIYYFIFSVFILVVISLQRIVDNAHNDVGLLLGVVISILGIIISNWDYFSKRIWF